MAVKFQFYLTENLKFKRKRKEYKRDVGLVGAAIWHSKGCAGDRQEKGIGEKLYHRGAVYVHFPFFCDGFAVGRKGGGGGIPLLVLYRLKIFCHFSGMDVQLPGD